MTFQIHALPRETFAPLFDLDETALASRRARWQIAESSPGWPCRVSLADADKGERLLLVNHEHLGGDTPYRASHAVYVRQNAAQARPEPGEVPDVIGRRLISLRAFGSDRMMVGADVLEGTAIRPAIEAMLADDHVTEVHLHIAGPGCYLARATRA